MRLGVSERRACEITGQHRSTQRYEPQRAPDDAALRKRLREISAEKPPLGPPPRPRPLGERGGLGREPKARPATSDARRTSGPCPQAQAARLGASDAESFNARLRDEVLDTELFSSLAEAKLILAEWLEGYNSSHAHSSLGMLPPGRFAAAWRPEAGLSDAAGGGAPARRPMPAPLALRVAPRGINHRLSLRVDRGIGSGQSADEMSPRDGSPL
jgi:hypothetical protein